MGGGAALCLCRKPARGHADRARRDAAEKAAQAARICYAGQGFRKRGASTDDGRRNRPWRQHGPYYCRRLSGTCGQPLFAGADGHQAVHQYREGYEALVESRNKEVVTALREIAAGKVLPDDLSLYNPLPEGQTVGGED